MSDIKTPPTFYKDAVDHPYDWVDPVAEYWAAHGGKPKAPGEWTPVPNLPGWYETYETSRLVETAADDPWQNGRYALASIVWGLIILLVLGLGAGP